MFRQHWCAVVGLAFFVSAALCTNFKYEECIRLDGTVQVTFSVSKDGKIEEEKTLLLETTAHINGTCATANATAAAMRIQFTQKVEWDLVFLENNKSVELDQMLTIVPAEVFNNTYFNESLDLVDTGNLVLSTLGHAFKCDSSLSITLVQKNATSDGRNYSATLVLSDLIVQAFGLENGNFTAVDTCDQDMSSPEADTTAVTGGTSAAAETTEATTEVPTTVVPPPVTPDFPNVTAVDKSLFRVKDKDNVTCFLLEAGLQLIVEYKTNSSNLYTRPIHLTPETAKVSGNCSNAAAVMSIRTNDTVLTITETMESNKKVTTQIHLNVTLDSTTFPNASEAGKTLEFNMDAPSLELDSTETYLRCNSFQKLRFNNETNTTLATNDVQLQSFGLLNGNFSGEGVKCSLDPEPPVPPAPEAGKNKYTVNGTFELCIVFLAKISFDNITYTDISNKTQTKIFNVPAINGTNVLFNGTCGTSVNSTEEKLEITFNKNWTLTLTFAEATPQAKEYSLRDIVLVYYQGLEYFPNASQPGRLVEVSAKNLTGVLQANRAGAYKCDAELKQPLSDGVEMKVSELQYKAFNEDYSDSFNNVSECSGDDSSNSIVPIAVGAALAGLVVIVLIAYLIGRRRSRRQGYESV